MVPAAALDPSGPAAEWYMSPAPRAAPDELPTRKLIADGIARLAAEAGVAAPARDGRLDRLADDVARLRPMQQTPSFELIAFLMSHYGVVEPEPQMKYGEADPRAPLLIVENLRPQLMEAMREIPRPRLGVGLAMTGDYLSVVLALQPQNLELRPVPRTLAAGLVAHLSGRLYRGYLLPKVIVSFADGTVDDLRVRGTAAGFEAAVGCRLDRRGVMQVEITAVTERGPTVLANFPIFCAVEPPAHSPELVLDTSGSLDPEAVEDQLLVLVNRDRARQGLQLLRLDRRLRDVARGYSREMAETGLVGHQSARSGNVADRLKRARIEVMLAGENVGLDYSAAGAHRGFMSSPGHRGNVVDPRMTVVGIGVVPGGQRNTNNLVPLYITEVFAAGSN
jgi:uncharacterized protein YkwD